MKRETDYAYKHGQLREQRRELMLRMYDLVRYPDSFSARQSAMQTLERIEGEMKQEVKAK